MIVLTLYKLKQNQKSVSIEMNYYKSLNDYYSLLLVQFKFFVSKELRI